MRHPVHFSMSEVPFGTTWRIRASYTWPNLGSRIFFTKNT